jgi:hypothetical protein
MTGRHQSHHAHADSFDSKVPANTLVRSPHELHLFSGADLIDALCCVVLL